ncbi:MAG: ThuA domain-containing protein [Chloroflexota bacterium]
MERVAARVRAGMGLVVPHSGQGSRIFQRLLGTTGGIELARGRPAQPGLTVAPGHPITEGVPLSFTIPAEEAYAEPFDIPAPDELVFPSLPFEGGEALPERLLLHPGQGLLDLLLPAGPRDASDVRGPDGPGYHRERGPVGRPGRHGGMTSG